MKLHVSNIKFNIENGLQVPSNLQTVKEWIADYRIKDFESNVVIQQQYEKYLNEVTDDQALHTYIRTALFYGSTELTYDVAVTDSNANDFEWQSMCVDAFDEQHEEYTTVKLKLEHADSVVYDIEQIDIECCYTDEPTEEALHQQLAFQYLLQYLPITATVL